MGMETRETATVIPGACNLQWNPGKTKSDARRRLNCAIAPRTRRWKSPRISGALPSPLLHTGTVLRSRGHRKKGARMFAFRTLAGGSPKTPRVVTLQRVSRTVGESVQGNVHRTGSGPLSPDAIVFGAIVLYFNTKTHVLQNVICGVVQVIATPVQVQRPASSFQSLGSWSPDRAFHPAISRFGIGKGNLV